MSLSQGQDDVNTYFTNLRILWDEYKHSQPIAWCVCGTCRCNSATKWHDYQEQECSMQFLIGLNSSFSQIRSSILSMIPTPPLSKVFSLVLQEERQRTIEGYAPTLIPSMSEQPYSAYATSQSYNKGRLCSHCGKTNHTVDKCFSLHGFPPSFGKGKNKFINKDSTFSKSVNFVDDSIDVSYDKSAVSPTIGAGVTIPSSEQCQQLIQLLQTQLAAATTLSTSTSSPSTSTAAPNNSQSKFCAPFTGTISYTSFVASIIRSKSTPIWLLDTGATHHVCCDLSMFSSYSAIQNASVNLPNGASASVIHIGSVILTSSITLLSVLCVPSFSFNLISISSLTSSLPCTVVFTHNSFEIQGVSQATVIGRGNRIGNFIL